MRAFGKSVNSDPFARADVRFTFLTDVSLLSGPNNLEDVSLDPRYATMCGYTDVELDRVFGRELARLDRNLIREWNNGYHWQGGIGSTTPAKCRCRGTASSGPGGSGRARRSSSTASYWGSGRSPPDKCSGRAAPEYGPVSLQQGAASPKGSRPLDPVASPRHRVRQQFR